MKIGIMTCWQPDDNYGTQIQCFALQHYLRNLGHDAFLIQYLRENDVIKKITLTKVLKAFSPFHIVRKLLTMRKLKKMQEETFSHNRNAPEFRSKYLKTSKIYNNYEELVLNPPEADLYIVGSDQVWNNFPVQKGQFNSFFLNFGNEKIKRISYAASFGFSRESIPKNYEILAKPLLKKFDGISIREKSGLDILKQWGGRFENSIRVSDPTLLLSADYYRKIYSENKINKPNKKYVLLYNLSSKSNIDCNKILEWAKSKNLELLYIAGHGQLDNLKKCYATIPEWLYLIDNAEYVFTNSFHGSIFSSIFHKKFVVFELLALYGSTNSRLDIIKELVSQNRIVNSVNKAFEIIDNEIDWDLFEKNKDDLVKIGRDFLNQYINKDL